jgi:hypothetical protein
VAECIDLMKIGGKKYRIRREPGPHTPQRSNAADMAWYWELLCKHGFVYPYSKTHLAAYTGKPRIRIKLAALAAEHGMEVVQYGDTECVVLFTTKQFGKIAALLQVRKRKQLSEEQKEVLRQRMAALHAARGEAEVEYSEDEDTGGEDDSDESDEA